jgi:hypothetical protein
MKQRRLVSAIFILSLASLTLQAAESFPAADSVKAKMTGQNLVYYVTKDPAARNVYVGIQYLQGLAFIAILSTADPDNVEFLEESLSKKDYKKVYKDLTMMKGNTYLMIFDSGMDSLSGGDSSRDFIKLNEKVYYLDKSYQDNGFASQDELEAFILKNREKYQHMIQVIDGALK